MKEIFNELNDLYKDISEEQISNVVNLLLESQDQKIIGLGAGRMGYSLQAFIMRLSHIGFKAYMIGDTTLPRIDSKSIILVNTSSGETPSILLLAKQAKDAGSTLVCFTTNKSSSIGAISDHVVEVKKIESTQLMKSIYEQFSYLLFDYVSNKIFIKGNFKKTEVERNHSILE